MTILSLLYKAATKKNLSELRISAWELNEEKYSDWVIERLRQEDPNLKVIYAGKAKEYFMTHENSCGSFELHDFKILSNITSKEIKNICMKLEMPGVVMNSIVGWQNYNGRLADIDVYVPGLLLKQKITRYKK